MEKIIYVKAYFKAVREEVTVKIPTGESVKRIFGRSKDVTRNVKRWQKIGHSDCEVDGERLAKDLQNSIDLLSQDGYSVKTIVPVITGKYGDYLDEKSGSEKESEHVSGVFSYTDSLLVHAVKN